MDIATRVNKKIQFGIWEVEICDLGACKPFLGYSLSDQYILVEITDPYKQNEVAITSIPESTPKTVCVPLVLSNFESQDMQRIKFKGLSRIMAVWDVQLVDTWMNVNYEISEKELLITARYEHKRAAFSKGVEYGFIKNQYDQPRFEVILSEK